jgi:hypothetical protein
MRSAFWLTAVAASAALLATCMKCRPSISDVEALALEIQGKQPDEVRAIMVKRFGPPARDVGSGATIEQWDVAGGVLTFHSFLGPTYAKDGVSIRLMRTSNPVETCLFGSYQETYHEIGYLHLSSDAVYHFKDVGSADAADQSDNFFVLHPSGSSRVEYAPGVTPQTHLEDVPDGVRVATVTFTARGGGARKALAIVGYRSSARLAFESPEPIPFFMEKGWVSYWP